MSGRKITGIVVDEWPTIARAPGFGVQLRTAVPAGAAVEAVFVDDERVSTEGVQMAVSRSPMSSKALDRADYAHDLAMQIARRHYAHPGAPSALRLLIDSMFRPRRFGRRIRGL